MAETCTAAAGVLAVVAFAASFAVAAPSADVDSSCAERAASYWCLRHPLEMAKDCRGHCEDHELNSKVRGRFLMDEMVPEAITTMLMRLAPKVVRPGDGFQGFERPFTPSERVSGIVPSDAAKWALEQPEEGGQRDAAIAWVRAYVDVSRKLRDVTEEHFGIIGRTFFDYIQLVCRQHDETKGPTGHLSHPPHADNCAWTKDGQHCIHDERVRTWRSHTATLYLNGHGLDDGAFEGGAFFFTPRFDSDPQDHVKVEPRAGLMLAYNSGPTNVHGVEEVTRGLRCQTSVWLTEDEERAHHAKELDQVEAMLAGVPPDENLDLRVDGNDWRSAQTRFYAIAQSKYENLCNSSIAGAYEPTVRDTIELPLPAEGRSLTAEIISDRPNPQVTRIRNFLTEEEISHVINVSSSNFKSATVFEAGKLVEAKYRTSQTSWLGINAGERIDRIRQRIIDVFGLSLASAEELQIARYQAVDQGRYEPHLDWGQGTRVQRDFHKSLDGSVEPQGGRIATLLIYLTEVPKGGHTVFVRTDLSVAPARGTAIFWYNLRPSDEGDELTRHGGCPVLEGEKFIMTQWIHERANEVVLDTAASFPRMQRDWSGVAKKLAGDATQKEPLVVRLSCSERIKTGRCALEPIEMATVCPGSCDEFAVESRARGRMVRDGVIDAETARLLATFGPKAASQGDGYKGKPRPFTLHETFAGTTPSAAAAWAKGQPADGGAQQSAIRFAQAYIDASRAVIDAMREHFNEPNLQADYVHLPCRTAKHEGQDAPEEPVFVEHHGYIPAGADILSGLMTPADAMLRCKAMPDCQGITFAGPPTDRDVVVYFKKKWELMDGDWTSYHLTVENPFMYNRNNDSHPIHADNCYKRGNNCIRDSPFFFWRSHSAILFIHDWKDGEFEGGEFFYSPTWDERKEGRVLLRPRTGRMLSFTAGPENLHGVNEVTNGTRCVVALWLTTDGTRAAAAHELDRAQEILDGASRGEL